MTDAALLPNILVVGSGRGGTSLVAGLIAGCGPYFVGSDLIEPSALNPTGFFEDANVNGINETLLSQVLPSYPKGSGRARKAIWLYRTSRASSVLHVRRPYRDGERWLAPLPSGMEFFVDDATRLQMKSLASREPFCFKDPRFCYTLDSWTPNVPKFKTVCVFRHPGDTIDSTVKALKTDRRVASFQMSPREADQLWCSMYESALRLLSARSGVLFVKYDDLVSGDGLDKLSEFIGSALPAEFVRPSLRRSSRRRVSRRSSELYERLCTLADNSA